MRGEAAAFTEANRLSRTHADRLNRLVERDGPSLS